MMNKPIDKMCSHCKNYDDDVPFGNMCDRCLAQGMYTYYQPFINEDAVKCALLLDENEQLRYENAVLQEGVNISYDLVESFVLQCEWTNEHNDIRRKYRSWLRQYAKQFNLKGGV